MTAPHTIALSMISALALNLTPGPGILFVLSRALGQGRLAAMVSVFGLAVASVIRAVAAAFGLAALFTYWPLAFAGIKYCGSRLSDISRITGFRGGDIFGLAGPVIASRPLSLAKVYRQGVLTDLLNPSAVVLLLVPAAIR
jgi:threonine/homoserine/homoserine lactone efflux protein